MLKTYMLMYIRDRQQQIDVYFLLKGTYLLRQENCCLHSNV